MPSTCWRRRERDARDRCARRRARRHGRRHGLWALHSGRRRRLPAGRGAPAPGPKGAPLQGAGDAARALRRPPRARPAARRTARGRPTRSGDRRRCELEPRQRGDGAEGRRDAAGGQRPRRQPARCAERLEQRRRKHSRDLVSLRRAEPDGLLGRDLRPRRDRARVAPPAGRTREPRRRRRRRAGRRGRAVAPGRRACRRGRARARARGASRLWRAPVRGACSTGAASDRPRRRLLRGARSPPDGHRRGPGLGRRAERHGRLRRPRRRLAGARGEEGRRVTTTAQPTTTVVTGRPRYEGANIRTWIGFKHFVYLVEEAVLHWFRERDLGARRLYHDFGLGLELVDVSVQLPAYLEVDDEVTAAVSEERLGRLSVRLSGDGEDPPRLRRLGRGGGRPGGRARRRDDRGADRSRPVSARPTLFFSFRSPFSWLLVERLRRHVADAHERIEFVPFWEPDPRMAAALAERDAGLHYVPMSKAKHLYILQDTKRLAGRLGLEMACPVDWVEEKALWRYGAGGAASVRGSGYWAVMRHETVAAVSRNPAVFSSGERGAFLPDPKSRQDLERTRQLLINMDAPEHRRIRRFVAAAFSPRTMQLLEEGIRAHARRLVAAALDREEFDVVRDLAAELPLLSLADLLGMPRADRGLLFEWSNRLVGFDDPDYGGSVDDYKRTFSEAFEYALELAAAKRRRPGDDLVSELVRLAVDPGHLSEREYCNLWVLLVVAGNETTRHLLSGGILALLEWPEERGRLVADPGLTPLAVEELLRWVSPVMQFRRTATCDVELEGRRVRAGDKVVLYYASANRDESVFPDAH